MKFHQRRSDQEHQWRRELAQWGLRTPHPSLQFDPKPVRIEHDGQGLTPSRRSPWSWWRHYGIWAGAATLLIASLLANAPWSLLTKAPTNKNNPVAMAAVMPNAPYRIGSVWALSVPPVTGSVAHIGTLTLPRDTTLTPLSMAQLFGAPAHDSWIVPQGGPVLWQWTPSGLHAVPVPVDSVAVVNQGALAGAIQRTDGKSLLLQIHGAQVTSSAWPIPAPQVWGPGFGATSGIAATPSGNVWIAGGKITHGALSALPEHGTLGPLFHPILAKVTPTGQVLQEATLSQLSVGGVTALTRAQDRSLWFGVNSGPYDETDILFRGMSALVHWNPATGQTHVYPVPKADANQAILDRLVIRGSEVWVSVQHSEDATDWGRPNQMLRLDIATGRWTTVTSDGAIFAWTVSPQGQLITVVQQDVPSSTMVEVNGTPIARAKSGYAIAGIGVEGSRVFALLVPINPNPQHRVSVQLLALTPR